MATQNQVNELKKLIEQFEKINLERVRRTELGKESLESDLAPRLEEIERLKKHCSLLSIGQKFTSDSLSRVIGTAGKSWPS